jgi:hypothetical protein
MMVYAKTLSLEDEGKLMGNGKPIKNLKNKRKQWKLLPIPANAPTTEGNQSPLHNETVMENENPLLVILGSRKKHSPPPLLSKPFALFAK